MSNQITMVFGAKVVKATISTSAVIGSNDNGFRYSYKEIWYSQDWNGELAWELVIFWREFVIFWSHSLKNFQDWVFFWIFFNRKLNFRIFGGISELKRHLCILDHFRSFWWNILLVTEGSNTILTLKNRPGTVGTHKHCTNTVRTSRRTP